MPKQPNPLAARTCENDLDADNGGVTRCGRTAAVLTDDDAALCSDCAECSNLPPSEIAEATPRAYAALVRTWRENAIADARRYAEFPTEENRKRLAVSVDQAGMFLAKAEQAALATKAVA